MAKSSSTKTSVVGRPHIPPTRPSNAVVLSGDQARKIRDEIQRARELIELDRPVGADISLEAAEHIMTSVLIDKVNQHV